ncbi:GNAT family N-acetyltransferase [Crocosphaera sp. XPORK-15E]|uniref:GNAT family N-acetyltransferase n=1 Tax=Crocosphaera sp. XPORK-15E TaxID=3110247 RepID=UPI002B2062C9|nr:GNAT family N-acetyltransferase [Crocosphaera sp. XPORK-15E]MEA5533104.1 GNAT family N-acetyltransferase [Crocosphaera sp. XPORK-15E]
MYYIRRTNLDDAQAIVPLWRSFLEARSQADPSMQLKANFNLEKYVEKQLKTPNSYGFVAENQQAIIGFLFTYIYDETLPPELSATTEMWDTPLKPRRVGSVLGLYVLEEHRNPKLIKELIDAAIAQAEALKVSDIDVLISMEQTGIHSLLEKAGFTKSAIQYTRHYNINNDDLPPLNLATSESIKVQMPSPGMIPLRDPKTQQNVLNPQGEQVFLLPVKDQSGNLLKTSSGLPVYSTPLRDPETQDWVFDELGKLVVCPVLLDEAGNIIEYQGIPIFCPPLYQRSGDKLILKQDSEGNYLFAEVEHNKDGTIKRSPDGKPMFKYD